VPRKESGNFVDTYVTKRMHGWLPIPFDLDASCLLTFKRYPTSQHENLKETLNPEKSSLGQ
jgi:hypothetical protein